MLVKEKLKNIVALNQQDSIEFLIAEHLLLIDPKDIYPTSNELSKKLNIHKSTLTQFAKKNDYAGYQEMIIRLMVEHEFYGIVTDKTEPLKKKKIIIEYEDDIDEYSVYVSRFAQMIKLSKKLYIIPSYEVDPKSMNLFAHGLNKTRPTFYANNRKIEQKYLDEATEEDLIIFFVTGLDNNEVNLYIKRAFNKKLNYIVFATKSQLSKISVLDPNNLLIINSVSGFSTEVRQLIRYQQIIKLLTNLLNLSMQA